MSRDVWILTAVWTVAMLMGCAQNTETPQTIPTAQEQIAKARQEQSTPNNVNVYVQNNPGNPALPNDSGDTLVPGADGATFEAGDALAAGVGGRNARAHNLQLSTVNVTISGTTGTQGTGGVSGQTATPSATATVTPKQEGSAAIPVTVALPGGAASGNASSAAGQGTATLTATQQQELRTLMDRISNPGTSAADRAAAQARINALLGITPPPPPAAP